MLLLIALWSIFFGNPLFFIDDFSGIYKGNGGDDKSVDKNSIESIANVTDISNCPQLENKRSNVKDASDLRADDIKVIMSMGDSVTAGFGATHTPTTTRILQEWRGKSFSSGVDDGGVRSIANFLGHYNSELVGGSWGRHLIGLCLGGWCPPGEYRREDGMNAAISGAQSSLLHHQWHHLRNMIEKEDLMDDWKLLNLFIGGNEICKVPDINKRGEYAENIKTALESIRKETSKIIINIVLLPDMSLLWDHIRDGGRWNCFHAMPILRLVCPLLLSSKQTRAQMQKQSKEINKILKDTTLTFNHQCSQMGRKDMRAIISPAIEYLDFSGIEDWISSVDCFHPTDLAHEWLATSIWNSLWVPLDRRDRGEDVKGGDGYNMKKIYCPNNSDRIQIN